MPEVIVCHRVVAQKMSAAYQTVRTFSMSQQQFVDLVDIDVHQLIERSPVNASLKYVLATRAAGMLAAFIHVISTEHCEVVCKGADGAIHKGANSAGSGLRWKGTDFLFTAIEAQP